MTVQLLAQEVDSFTGYRHENAIKDMSREDTMEHFGIDWNV